MFSFIFKTGTYFFIWKKFRANIISILISTLLIWLVFSIYDDLVKIFKLEDTTTLLYLLFGKWLIVVMIILFNLFSIKNSKRNLLDDNDTFEEEIAILPIKSQEILNKKDILTTTDLILKKYKKNDNE